MDMQLKKLHDWAENNARECIFPFWCSDFIRDPVNGGFYGRVTLDMQVDHTEPRGLTLAGRMVYAFSTAYRIFGEQKYAEAADYAYADLVKRFYDPEFGGAYTSVSAEGQTLADNKPIYCEAFWVMGCAAYGRARNDGRAIDLAMECARKLENCGKWAPASYYNNMNRDWTPAEGMGFGKGGGFEIPEGAVMFPHHLCQAYVQLYRARPDEMIRKSLREMLDFILTRLFDPEHCCFKTIVAADGSRGGMHQSFGHDCEISYLAMTVAQLVGTEDEKRRMKELVTKVLYRILEADFDAYGSLCNGGDLTSGEREASHVWWAQAEAVTAMLCGYQLTGDRKFLDACMVQVEFIEAYFVDWEHGDWYSNILVDETGGHIVDGMHGFDKLNGGKCPFHNSQMCFEVMHRTAQMMEDEEYG